MSHCRTVMATCTLVSGSLPPGHAAFSDCGWSRQPVDMEGGCEYIE